MVSFNTTVRQMTKMSQQRMTKMSRQTNRIELRDLYSRLHYS